MNIRRVAHGVTAKGVTLNRAVFSFKSEETHDFIKNIYRKVNVELFLKRKVQEPQVLRLYKVL
jgi:hypothetical protein